MFYSLRKSWVIFLFISFLINISCKKEQAPLPEIGDLFSALDTTIQEKYGFTDSPGFSMKDIYARSLQAIGKNANPDEAGRQLLIEALSGIPEEERREKIDLALRAYVKALPMGYNDIVSPESIKLSQNPRHTAGAGIIIRKDGPGRFYIVDVLEDSPAGREKVKEGVYIKSIDGQDVSQIDDLEMVVGIIKGLPDTEVIIETGIGSYKLIRGPVQLRNIANATWKLSEGRVAEYIMIRTTLPGTSRQLRGLLMGLEKRDAVILDLRKLHTGTHTESFAIADLFLPETILGYLISNHKVLEKFQSDADQLFTGPLIIITGKDSSPFAHILASVLAEKSGTVITVGSAPQNTTFISDAVQLPGGYEARYSTAAVANSDEHPMYETSLRIDVPVIKDILPDRMPGSAPSDEDPGQAAAAEAVP